VSKMNNTAQAIIYETIREKILNGDYTSNTKLTETKLAEEFKVSRTPVREAIYRLKQEGLIKNNRIYKPTETDFRHHFEMRILIESYAARMAANYMSESNINKLQKCIDIARKGDSDDIVQINKKYHDLIVQESRNPIMIDTVDKMGSIIYLFSRTVVLHERPFLIDEHQQIKDAILKRNPDKAAKLMKQHLKTDLEFSLNVI